MSLFTVSYVVFATLVGFLAPSLITTSVVKSTKLLVQKGVCTAALFFHKLKNGEAEQELTAILRRHEEEEEEEDTEEEHAPMVTSTSFTDPFSDPFDSEF